MSKSIIKNKPDECIAENREKGFVFVQKASCVQAYLVH